MNMVWTTSLLGDKLNNFSKLSCVSRSLKPRWRDFIYLKLLTNSSFSTAVESQLKVIFFEHTEKSICCYYCRFWYNWGMKSYEKVTVWSSSDPVCCDADGHWSQKCKIFLYLFFFKLFSFIHFANIARRKIWFHLANSTGFYLHSFWP